MSLKKSYLWLLAMADLLLPRTCLICGRKLGLRELHLCLYCLAEMPLTYFWQRSHNLMADKINGLIQEGLYEGTMALKPRVRYEYACALFFYQDEGGYRNILYSLKYGGNTAVGKYLGKILGQKMAAAAHFSDVDAVVPVPLHWTRKWKRGYNQAECIAEAIAHTLDAKLRTDLLFRQRRTTTQTKLAIDDKMRNVARAFKAVADGPIPSHILLVDDVFTTGSTLFACYCALRSVFPPSVRISVATLAFVGRP